MKKKFKKDYDYCPGTFLIPDDFDKFKKYTDNLKLKDMDDNRMWIVKPNKLSRGRGIYLIKDADKVDEQEPGVVSEYVSNPL